MKKIKSSIQFFLNFRYYLIGLLLFSNVHLNGQTGEKESKALDQIAQYLSISSFTDDILTQDPIAYSPPVGSLLEKEWPTLNAMNKIAVAYKAAENNLPKVGGQHFLALLSQTLAQRYHEAARVEPLLTDYINMPFTKVEFANLPMNISSSVITEGIHPHIIEVIGKIANYTDAGALGGTREVLKTHFDMEESKCNEIMMKNQTGKSALIEGATLALVPPPLEERLKGATKELFIEFESSKYDKILLDLFNEEEKKVFKINKSAEKNKTVIPENEETVKKAHPKDDEIYNKFLDDTDGKGKPQKFDQMKIDKKGFGGIILGNKFTTTFDKDLKLVKWIPYNIKGLDSLKRGRFEFVFLDGSVLKFNNVLQEDVYAANELIYNYNHIEGNGIGLTGLTYMPYPNGIKRHEIVIHPTLKHLRLGWSLITTDAYPECVTDIKDQLKENNLWTDYEQAFAEWEELKPEGWKISEKSLLISKKNNEIIIVDSLKHTDNFFTMVGDKDNYESELLEFEKLLPAFMEISPEYKRLRDFTKVVTLFRWAKSNNCPIVGLKTFKFNDFVAPANSLTVSSDKRLEFYTFSKDRDSLREAIKLMRDSLDSKIHKQVVAEVDNTSKNRQKIWAKVEKMEFDTSRLVELNSKKEYNTLDNYVKKKDAYLKYLDTLYALNKDSINEITVKLKQVNEDSFKYFNLLLYFQIISKKDSLLSQSKIEKEIKQFEDRNVSIFKKYRQFIEYSSEIIDQYNNQLILNKKDKLYILYNLLNYEIKILNYYARKNLDS